MLHFHFIKIRNKAVKITFNFYNNIRNRSSLVACPLIPLLKRELLNPSKYLVSFSGQCFFLNYNIKVFWTIKLF